MRCLCHFVFGFAGENCFNWKAFFSAFRASLVSLANAPAKSNLFTDILQFIATNEKNHCSFPVSLCDCLHVSKSIFYPSPPAFCLSSQPSSWSFLPYSSIWPFPVPALLPLHLLSTLLPSYLIVYCLSHSCKVQALCLSNSLTFATSSLLRPSGFSHLFLSLDSFPVDIFPTLLFRCPLPPAFPLFKVSGFSQESPIRHSEWGCKQEASTVPVSFTLLLPLIASCSFLFHHYCSFTGSSFPFCSFHSLLGLL